MQTSQAIALAKQLLNEHGYGYVPIRLTRTKVQLGRVSWKRDRSIHYMGLSAHHIMLNDEDEIRETILHEIAHMIAGPKVNHGTAWKLAAKRIGAKPERCSSVAVCPPGRYKAICQQCNKSAGTRHRISAKMFRLIHKGCRGKLRWYDTVEKRWVDPSEAKSRRRNTLRFKCFYQ